MVKKMYKNNKIKDVTKEYKNIRSCPNCGFGLYSLGINGATTEEKWFKLKLISLDFFCFKCKKVFRITVEKQND